MALEALKALFKLQAQRLSWPNSAELQESNRDDVIRRDSGAALQPNVFSLNHSKPNLWCLQGKKVFLLDSIP